MPAQIDCSHLTSCGPTIGDCAGPCAVNLAASTYAEVIAPFAQLTFFNQKNETLITVGNESSPQFHNGACIKSLEIGVSDGLTVNVEIFDEEGGAFDQFEKRILKSLECASQAPKAVIEYGWILNMCDGSRRSMFCDSPIIGTLLRIKVTFADGKIRYNLEFKDLMQAVFVAREDDIFGADGRAMGIQEAMKQLGNKNEPKIEVKFLKSIGGGATAGGVQRAVDNIFGFLFGTPPTASDDEWKFANNPKSKWVSDGENKRQVMHRWAENFTSEDGKGMISMWDCTNKKKPTVLMWEDPQPGCNENAPACGKNCLGTFIVNGGVASNVLSFSPEIEYVSAMAAKNTGGGTGGPMTGKTIDTNNPKDNNKDPCTKSWNQQKPRKTGLLTATPANENVRDTVGPKDSPAQIAWGQKAQSTADKAIVSNIQQITAEMTIQGSPDARFSSPPLRIGATCSIIVINPIHLRGKQSCDSWLADPPCNRVMTSCKWMLKGVSHSIKEGSFTTTLKLFLPPPPGVDDGSLIDNSGCDTSGGGQGWGGTTTK